MECEKSGKGLMPPAYLLLALGLMLASDWLLPGPQLVSGSARLLGCLPLALGLGMNLAADRAMKQVRTPVNPFATTSTLITWGIFGWSRNPMYFGATCILFGVGLLLGSLTTLVFPLLFALIMQRSFIRPEETKLKRAFPESWMNYATQTRRWI